MQSTMFGHPGLYPALYSNSECRALYWALQVYIQCYIQHPSAELYIRPSSCRALHSALQVYIQHYIQHPSVELYFRSSRSTFKTLFNIRMQSSIFSPPGLYSTLYSHYECRVPGLFNTVFKLRMQSSRSIFSTIF